MVKKIFFYIIGFFTLFAALMLFAHIYFYKSVYNKATYLISAYQYNFIIKSNIGNKLELIKQILNQYYTDLHQNKIKSKMIITDNDVRKLDTLLKTLKSINFKDYKSFLLKYIYNNKHGNIKIVKNDKIIISQNLIEVGQKFDFPCNPLSNYGECFAFKNEIYYSIKYSHPYGIYIINSFNVNKLDKKDSLEDILLLLKTIPNIIVYHNGKKLKGEFKNDEFYIFDEFKPLKIFFGFGVKYKTIKYLSNSINQEIISYIIKPLLLYFALAYLGIVLSMYFVLFTIFRKKMNFIEKVLNDYNQKATIDKLTGVFNRNGFENLTKNNHCKYFLIIDLDNFKYINDTFGHKKGDYILKEFSWLLKKYFKNDIIGRWGGDEFLVCSSKKKQQIIEIIKIINNNLQKIQKEFDDKLTKKLSVSAGACENDTIDMQKRFNNADLALYKVKKSNKGHILFYRDIDYIKIEKEDIVKN